MNFKVFHATNRKKVSDYWFDCGGNLISDEENRVNLVDLSKSNPSSFILEMEYRFIAVVTCDTIHDVFQLTNSIDYHWSQNFGVNAVVAVEIPRSTSTGDLILDLENNKVYIVESMGMRLLGE